MQENQVKLASETKLHGTSDHPLATFLNEHGPKILKELPKLFTETIKMGGKREDRKIQEVKTIQDREAREDAMALQISEQIQSNARAELHHQHMSTRAKQENTRETHQTIRQIIKYGSGLVLGLATLATVVVLQKNQHNQ